MQDDVRSSVVRGTRHGLTAVLGVSAGVALASFAFPGIPLVIGDSSLRLPATDDAVLLVVVVALLRAAVEPRALEEAARIRRNAAGRPAGWLGIVLTLLLGLNLLLAAFSLGHSIPEAVRAAGRLASRSDPTARVWSWASREAGPRPFLRKCLEETAPEGRILIAAPEWRDHRAYFLAYYLYPRSVMVLPTEQERLFFGPLHFRHREADPAMAPPVDLRPPTDEEYRDFIGERGIDKVILLPERETGRARILPAGEAFR